MTEKEYPTEVRFSKEYTESKTFRMCWEYEQFWICSLCIRGNHEALGKFLKLISRFFQSFFPAMQLVREERLSIPSILNAIRRPEYFTREYLLWIVLGEPPAFDNTRLYRYSRLLDALWHDDITLEPIEEEVEEKREVNGKEEMVETSFVKKLVGIRINGIENKSESELKDSQAE